MPFFPRVEKSIGIDFYATKTTGVGGAIRENADDFLVEEVLVDGSKAEIGKVTEKQVLGTSPSMQRYLLCVLVKRNWDTLIAIGNIAKQLGISQRRLHIAGIKDAKAVTAQHIEVENCSIEDVEKVNIKDIEVRPLGYVRKKLSQYYLLGNHFAIRIKAIKSSESTIIKRVSATIRELEDNGGMPNLFGHQRFGTARSITHLVGKAVAKGDFEDAAMLFLAKPSVHEHPDSRQARKDLQSTQNFKIALQNYPKQLRYERLMLRHLVEKPADFVGAFKRLPLKLQMLFVQAYQSYLFNCFLSARVKNGFSLNQAEVGDYVVNVDRSGLPMLNTAKVVGAGTVAAVRESVKVGRMRVALPLIGLKQKPSQGAMGLLERQILEKEEVKTENFRIEAIPEISVRGWLRAIVTPILDFKLRYVSVSTANGIARQADMGFMLLRGSYATVLLREVMKPRSLVNSGF